MRREKRYNQGRSAAVRPLRGYGRRLRFLTEALLRALRGELAPDRLLWAADRASELLAAGFPSLLSVPEELYAQSAALYPERLRLKVAGKSAEEILASLRLVSDICGERFDWDRFLARCERESRRARLFRAVAETVLSLAPPEIDTRSPAAALRTLERMRET